ncbi:hypothetical protein ABTM14_20125, partial [Acinetobacter baumannii]
MLTQNRVSMATPSLPVDVRNYGVNTKKSLTFPLIILSLYSPHNTYDPQFINNYNYINLVDKVKRLKGV